jgi:ABC-type dipeptide/oligopeptide/nickel transport system permease subunit
MKKKLLSIVLCVVMAASLMIGCGSKKDTNEANNTADVTEAADAQATATSAPTEAASDEKVTISYGVWDAGEADKLQQLATDFEAETGIHVDIQVTAWTDYWTALEAAATGGSLPDTFWMHSNNIYYYASNGQLMDLTNYMSGSDIDLKNTDALLKLWFEKYDPKIRPEGMTKAERNYYERLNNNLKTITSKTEVTVADKDPATGALVENKVITNTDYVNIKDVANVIHLPLGTDNFGADVLKKLVAALGTSLIIGLLAGVVATIIGLTLGLLAGFLGGNADDGIMFVTNIFTVIPSFVLLILITYSVGEAARGVATVAIVIGLTSWTWTARSVRSQVISLRNRDHVNLSKLSGHSLFRIILTDILPYIASYVVMALILQISTAILAEAQLSMLGLGPKTTERPTLGLMMNWAMLYSAHINGSWWAYFPVLIIIALISFSLNLMNTGLDQVFNPTLRD